MKMSDLSIERVCQKWSVTSAEFARKNPEKLQLSEKIPAVKLQDSPDSENVTHIFGMFRSEHGSLLFADNSNGSVKELQLQTKSLKTLYRTETYWYVLNVLLHSDSQTLFVCECKGKYVLCVRSASLLFSTFCFLFS